MTDEYQVPAGSGDHSPGEVLSTAKGLTDALQGMIAELGALRAYARRSRRIIAALAVSLALDVTLTVIVAIITGQVSQDTAQASATLTQLHKAQVAGCVNGNEFRASQVRLWEHLVSLAVTNSTPAAVRRTDEQLLAYIRKAFAPRNCAAAYRLHGLTLGGA